MWVTGIKPRSWDLPAQIKWILKWFFHLSSVHLRSTSLELVLSKFLCLIVFCFPFMEMWSLLLLIIDSQHYQPLGCTRGGHSLQTIALTYFKILYYLASQMCQLYHRGQLFFPIFLCWILITYKQYTFRRWVTRKYQMTVLSPQSCYQWENLHTLQVSQQKVSH